MGVDLTFCPDRHGRSGPMDPWFLAHTRIDTDRHYAFQDAVRALGTQPLPPHVRFDWYGDEGIQARTEDPYGSPLRYLTAGQFWAIPEAVLADTSHWNRALVLFFRTIEPQRAIVLWWH